MNSSLIIFISILSLPDRVSEMFHLYDKLIFYCQCQSKEKERDKDTMNQENRHLLVYIVTLLCLSGFLSYRVYIPIYLNNQLLVENQCQLVAINVNNITSTKTECDSATSTCTVVEQPLNRYSLVRTYKLSTDHTFKLATGDDGGGGFMEYDISLVNHPLINITSKWQTDYPAVNDIMIGGDGDGDTVTCYHNKCLIPSHKSESESESKSDCDPRDVPSLVLNRYSIDFTSTATVRVIIYIIALFIFSYIFLRSV
jgi:hypothetical protein